MEAVHFFIIIIILTGFDEKSMLHINLNKMTCWFISDQFCPLTWLQIKLWARHDTWYFLIFSLWFLYIDLSATFIASFYSCSHQWASQELCWFESSLTDRSFKVARGGEVSKHIIWSWGYLRDHFLLHIHYNAGTHYTDTWFLLPLLCWWHTALLLISTRWSNELHGS